jgi:hypothetical protein
MRKKQKHKSRALVKKLLQTTLMASILFVQTSKVKPALLTFEPLSFIMD